MCRSSLAPLKHNPELTVLEMVRISQSMEALGWYPGPSPSYRECNSCGISWCLHPRLHSLCCLWIPGSGAVTLLSPVFSFAGTSVYAVRFVRAHSRPTAFFAVRLIHCLQSHNRGYKDTTVPCQLAETIRTTKGKVRVTELDTVIRCYTTTPAIYTIPLRGALFSA